MTVRILSSDLLICDVLLPLREHPEILPLIAQYNAVHPEHPIVSGSKSPLTQAEFVQWQQVVGVSGHYVAGGSAANSLSALKQLLGEAVRIEMIAAYGADSAGRVVAASLAQDQLHLWPQNAPYADVQTAISFVLLEESGERSIVGYGGSSREKILAASSAGSLLDAYDILFLPGSLWQKYGAEFSQRLYQSSRDGGKKLWLSLPTHSQSGRDYNDAVRALIPQADVVLANADELQRLYAEPHLETALEHLQKVMGSHVAFITHGRQGAMVVTSDAVLHVSPEMVPADAIKNTLGAGDAAFAGFLYGLLRNMPHEKSAQIAMKLAAAALRTETARLVNISTIFS